MSRAKAPAFQFYPADWLSDMELQACDPVTRGIWINFLCYMWKAPERGKLEGNLQEFCRLGGCTKEQLLQFINDAKKHKFCDVNVRLTFFIRKNDAIMTLINRRMYKDEIKRLSHRERQKRYYYKSQKSDAKMTQTSRSLSSSSSSISNKAIGYNKEAYRKIEKEASQPDQSISPSTPKKPSKEFWQWFQESFNDKFGSEFDELGIKSINQGLMKHFDHIVHEYGNYNILMLCVMKRMQDIRRRKKIEHPDRFLIGGLFSKNGNGGYLWETTPHEEETVGHYAKEYLRRLDRDAADNLGLTDDD